MTSIGVLVHLLLMQLLITSAYGDFVPNVTVSTLEGVSFTYTIRDMKPHPSDPNSLLLIDYHAILSLNVLTKQTSTVAGAVSSNGYVEGVGESARFNYPYSLIIISEKRIIVTDWGNHCLRDVDISTGQTNPLAGTCRSYGFTDGEALQAQFKYPCGLLQYKTGVLVADRNNMVRWLNAGRVSTLVQGSPVRRPYYFTERDGVVYIGTNSGVVKLDPETAAVQLIAGHEYSTGFSDGPLLSARFKNIRGLVSLSPDLILLADYRNERLRLLDLQNNTVRSICTGTKASVDGAADQCQLYDPQAITILYETIYVGGYNRIRTIPLQSLIRKDPPKVEVVIKFCPPSVNLTIPAGQTAVHHAWPQPGIEGGDVACIMCPKGNSKLFPPGETLISYIYPSNVAASQRVECNFTVSVTEVCPPSYSKTTTDIGESFANVEIADSNHSLPEGNHSVETKLTDGRICITTIEVSEGFEVNCPGSITTQLQKGIKKTKVSWSMPQLKGVNQSDVECSSCPAKSAEFGVGVHTIEYKYTYAPTNFSMSCSFAVVVIGPDNGEQRCSPVVLGLKKGEQTAKFVIMNNQQNVSVRFPVGVYEVETTDQSGESCLTAVKVYDTNPAVRSVLLQVSYPAECDKLNGISYVVIRSFLQQHFAALTKSCQECRLVGDQPYEMNCQTGVLVVQWTTNIQTDSEIGDIPDEVKTAVLKKLKVIQDSYLNLDGRFLEITVITGTPTVVSPLKNDHGLYLRLHVVASCSLPRMVYDTVDDACYIP